MGRLAGGIAHDFNNMLVVDAMGGMVGRLSGDDVRLEIDAPAGTLMARVAPVFGSTSVRPLRLLVVSDRARFARVSTCTPPSQTCGAPYALMSPRSLPVARRNQRRSGLAFVNEISTRGVVIIRTRFSGGFTNDSVRRICCASQPAFAFCA